MITVTWDAQVINVPKADLTLVQSTPTEIRELDLNWFRLQLKDLEDSEEGMAFDDTHRHNQPVTVGGVTLARVIEIINDYTVTFEDGQYAVNLIGANSNVADRVNVNQVSVRAANSAGLVTSAAIEFGEYGGGVTLDTTNGEAGTIYPIGTNRRPSGNLADALMIASARGFKKIFVKGNLLLSNSDFSAGYIFIGESSQLTSITIQTLANVSGCEFQSASISGTLDGNNVIRDCVVGALNYVDGQLIDCILLDVLLLAGSSTIRVSGCSDGFAGSLMLPTFDFDGGGRDLIVSDYDGSIMIQNLAQDDSVEIAIARGHVFIDETVTAGIVVLAGVASLHNNGTPTSLDVDALMSKDTVASAVLNTNLSTYNSPGTVGLTMARTDYGGKLFFDSVNGSPGTVHPIGTFDQPVNNLADLKVLMATYNINHIHLHSDLTLTVGTSMDFMVIESHPSYLSLLTVEAGVSLQDAIFKQIKVTGELSQPASFVECYLEDITGVCGNLYQCMFDGSVGFLAGQDVQLIFCRSHYASEVLFNVGTSKVTTVGWVGMAQLLGKSGVNQVNFQMDWGAITLADTCVEGLINLFGHGWYVDNSDGATVVVSGMINKEIQAEAMLAAAMTSPIYSDTRKVRGQTVIGTGVGEDYWRPE